MMPPDSCMTHTHRLERISMQLTARVQRVSTVEFALANDGRHTRRRHQTVHTHHHLCNTPKHTSEARDNGKGQGGGQGGRHTGDAVGDSHSNDSGDRFAVVVPAVTGHHERRTCPPPPQRDTSEHTDQQIARRRGQACSTLELSCRQSIEDRLHEVLQIIGFLEVCHLSNREREYQDNAHQERADGSGARTFLRRPDVPGFWSLKGSVFTTLIYRTRSN
jgi:hypothetical protein